MTKGPTGRRRCRKAFLLLETMMGVAVFAIGVLAMAKCVENCLDAEIAKMNDRRARLALENRMAEVEAGAVQIDEGSEQEEKLEGMFNGITLQQSRKAFPFKDENDQEVQGLFVVDLRAVWTSSGEDQSKGLTFYVFKAE
jgi:Tfp pilus assembly protein PilV